ncbi:MAG: deoxyribonuclease IV [Propionibacteriaceae bacterium]|nr:deoxyribonuclease IV [Propionibacteriaceae bacterium]
MWGAHAAGPDPLAEAAALGATAVQIMLGDPRSWTAPALGVPDGPAAFRAAAEAAGVAVFVHAAYVVNVASLNNRVRIPSRKLLQQTLDLAGRLGARGVVVHGGHLTAHDDPAAGRANWRKAVDTLDLAVPLYIENTAGGANAMARTADRIVALRDALADSPHSSRVGWCFDTCHAHAAGFDLATAAADFRAAAGRIDLVHANDSRDLAGSGADRHANLGRGLCDPAALRQAILSAEAPLIMETPGSLAERQADRDWLGLTAAA